MPGLTTAKELREKRAQLANEAREIVEAARSEDRDLSAEESQKFDAIHEDIEAFGKRVAQIERQEQIDRELAESTGRKVGPEPTERDAPALTEKRRWDAIKAWALDDRDAMEEHRDVLKQIGATRKEVPLQFMTSSELREHRAQSTGTDSAGGYTVPQGFRAVLEEALLQFGGMRQSRATVLRTASGNQMEIPTSNDTSNSGALLAENTQDSEQDIAFGQAVLDAYKYTSKIIRVSKELLQDSAFDMPSFLGRALGERLGRIHNTHFTTGTGSAQPQGVVTGATDSTVVAASATTVTYSELVQLIHSVDPAYRQNAQFMFSDATLSAIKQMLDSQNRPLWVPGVGAGQPDRIAGYTYVINQDVADPAIDAKSILFGDFSKFFIRDVLDFSLVRMDERYADFHQVAWVAISRNDSVLVDAGTNPIKYLTQAAA